MQCYQFAHDNNLQLFTNSYELIKFNRMLKKINSLTKDIKEDLFKYIFYLDRFEEHNEINDLKIALLTHYYLLL